VVTPFVAEGYKSSWAQYTILLKDKEERDRAQRELKEKGIPSMIYYPRGLHQQEAYKWMNLPDEWYIKTKEATQRVLSLPMHPYLQEKDMEEICDAVVKAVV